MTGLINSEIVSLPLKVTTSSVITADREGVIYVSDMASVCTENLSMRVRVLLSAQLGPRDPSRPIFSGVSRLNGLLRQHIWRPDANAFGTSRVWSSCATLVLGRRYRSRSSVSLTWWFSLKRQLGGSVPTGGGQEVGRLYDNSQTLP
jgi:hypothetical protein